MAHSKKTNGGSSDDSLRDDQPSNLSRRNLLKSAGIMGAAAVSSATASNVIAADSPASQSHSTADIVATEALEVLTAEEAETLEAICDCLIPSDDNGPGAKEARAIHYIDRSLASENISSRHDYMVSISAINDFARKTRGKPYYQLITDEQNSILLGVQRNRVPGCSPSGPGFFNMVRSHTIDGTFCDPYYGGNQNFVGWDMLRYPGIRLGASETDVSQGANLEPNHQSAYDNQTYTKMAANIRGDVDSNGGNDYA
ncbi:MAG: gluconate 2-dehydrogenase subunit 3 family protein [Gammaproteobacteria bacterium]|jgi:gluconate 2-dehydrogenase gamma chain|nr:gluconate 2-dehydrogenase subunit 3 family protein [Gammaproteobacteria bacterium]MBT3859050.1 gluconate 2-dehydrogenase subunit 3 family protein [Gammaproteobacteria bacterium]MBT3987839.1 gluconate 2-dehydrogenase subunit 3 family protein [Gammaproteobacteria bacterium]MBT4257203.1 gluconate 2-dehydrogenase subunit 3 family protein [Gammaproteobacteria bacterium]MBT4581514.1 gluconate 2-dehydrogenase subunit 3 family protein [Gammaproteobacteria bacterium]